MQKWRSIHLSWTGTVLFVTQFLGEYSPVPCLYWVWMSVRCLSVYRLSFKPQLWLSRLFSFSSFELHDWRTGSTVVWCMSSPSDSLLLFVILPNAFTIITVVVVELKFGQSQDRILSVRLVYFQPWPDNRTVSASPHHNIPCLLPCFIFVNNFNHSHILWFWLIWNFISHQLVWQLRLSWAWAERCWCKT